VMDAVLLNFANVLREILTNSLVNVKETIKFSAIHMESVLMKMTVSVTLCTVVTVA